MITVEEFMTHFKRDFPYLPLYKKGKVYFTDDVVYNEPNFYKSLVDDNDKPLSDKGYWKIIKEDEDNYLNDSDIEKAINEALMSFPLGLFDEKEEQIKLVFMYLVAFYLVVDIQNSTSGLDSKGYAEFVASKSVSGVSESYAVPSWVNNDPMLNIFMSNGYGKKYLSYIIPRTKGFLYVSAGGTTVE